MSLRIEIPISTNAKRFAVANIKHGIIVLTGEEDYCKLYCSRQNQEFGYHAYHVIPYSEQQEKFTAITPLKVLTQKNENLYTKQELKETIKSKVAAYLAAQKK